MYNFKTSATIILKCMSSTIVIATCRDPPDALCICVRKLGLCCNFETTLLKSTHRRLDANTDLSAMTRGLPQHFWIHNAAGDWTSVDLRRSATPLTLHTMGLLPHMGLQIFDSEGNPLFSNLELELDNLSHLAADDFYYLCNLGICTLTQIMDAHNARLLTARDVLNRHDMHSSSPAVPTLQCTMSSVAQLIGCTSTKARIARMSQRHLAPRGGQSSLPYVTPDTHKCGPPRPFLACLTPILDAVCRGTTGHRGNLTRELPHQIA